MALSLSADEWELSARQTAAAVATGREGKGTAHLNNEAGVVVVHGKQRRHVSDCHVNPRRAATPPSWSGGGVASTTAPRYLKTWYFFFSQRPLKVLRGKIPQGAKRHFSQREPY